MRSAIDRLIDGFSQLLRGDRLKDQLRIGIIKSDNPFFLYEYVTSHLLFIVPSTIIHHCSYRKICRYASRKDAIILVSGLIASFTTAWLHIIEHLAVFCSETTERYVTGDTMYLSYRSDEYFAINFNEQSCDSATKHLQYCGTIRKDLQCIQCNNSKDEQHHEETKS